MLRNTVRQINLLIQEIKYNPYHDAHGRFSGGHNAHLVIGRDGSRSFGPKHPQHPNNLMTPQKRMSKMLNEKHPPVRFNLDDVDPKFAERIGEHLDKLLTQYPDVKKYLEYVGTVQPDEINPKKTPPDWAVDDKGGFAMGSNTYAYVSTVKFGGQANFKNAMILNTYHFSDEKSMGKNTLDNAATHWHPFGTDDPISVISHEFGHLVHFSLLYGGEDKAMPGMSFIGKADKEGEVARMTNYWSNQHISDGYAVSKYASSTWDSDKVSGMKEMFAEGFAQMIHAHPRSWMPYTASLKSLLDLMGDSTMWTKDPKKTDLKKDTIAAGKAKQKINDLLKKLRKSKDDSLFPPLPHEEVQLVDYHPHVEFEDRGKGYTAGPE